MKIGEKRKRIYRFNKDFPQSIVLMAITPNYVMVRVPRCSPFVMSLEEYEALEVVEKKGKK